MQVMPAGQKLRNQRYAKITHCLKPGSYPIRQVADQCNIPYTSLVYMLNLHPSARVKSERSRQGLTRIVKVLPAKPPSGRPQHQVEEAIPAS